MFPLFSNAKPKASDRTLESNHSLGSGGPVSRIPSSTVLCQRSNLVIDVPY